MDEYVHIHGWSPMRLRIELAANGRSLEDGDINSEIGGTAKECRQRCLGGIGLCRRGDRVGDETPSDFVRYIHPARLDSLVAVLGGGSTEPPHPVPALAQTVSGRDYEFAQNRRGIRRITLHFTPGASEAGLDFVVGAVPAKFTIGMDGAFRISELYGQRWACRGHWTDDDTFVLEQEFMGKVIRREITMKFHGDTLELNIYDPITNTFDTFEASAVP